MGLTSVTSIKKVPNIVACPINSVWMQGIESGVIAILFKCLTRIPFNQN